MNSADLAPLRDNIKRLVDTSAFMPKKLREKVLKRISDPQISREKLERITKLLKKVHFEEEKVVKEVLDKDPLFFARRKHQKSREKLEKNQKLENLTRQQEISEIESELSNFLES